MPTLLQHGGSNLLQYNGQIIAWYPTAYGTLSGRGHLTAHASSLLRPAALSGYGALTGAIHTTIVAANIGEPVVYDATGASASGVNSSTGISETHIVGERAQVMLIGVTGYATTARVSSTVTVAGFDATLLGLAALPSSNGWVELWGLQKPPAGAQQVTIYEICASGYPNNTVSSVTYSGGVRGFGTTVTASGTSTSPSTGTINTTGANDIVDGVIGAASSPTGAETVRSTVGSTVITVPYGLMQDTVNSTGISATTASTAWGAVGVDLQATGLLGHGMLTGGLSAQISTLIDNFSTEDAQWYWGAGLSVANDQLSITCSSSYYTTSTVEGYNLTNNAVSVQAVQQPNISDGSTVQQMTIYPFGATTPFYAFSWNDGNLVVSRYVGSGATLLNIAYNTSTMGWWRIKESAGTIYFQTAPDGLTWTTQYSEADAFPLNNLSVQLSAGCGVAATSPGTAIFANVNLYQEYAALSGRGALTATATTAGITRSATLSGQGVLTATAIAVVAYDSSGGGVAAHTANPSWSHTIGANADCLVVVIAAVTQFATAVEVGSTPLTQTLFGQAVFGTGNLSMWYLLNPPTGAQTISVTCTTSYIAAASTAYQNVASIGDAMGLSNETGTPQTASILPGDLAASLMVAVFASNHTSGSFGSFSGTVRSQAGYVSTTNPAFIYGDLSGASATAITVNSPGSNCALQGLALLPLAKVTVSGFPSGTGTLTAAANATKFVLTGAASGHGVLTPTPDGAYGGRHLTGHGALSATAKATEFVLTATLHGHGVLTPTPDGGYGGRHLTGHGALSATANATKFVLTCALSGNGLLTATSGIFRPAALSGHGVLTATDKPKLAATLSGHGALSATANATKFVLTGAASGHGVLTPTPDGAYGGAHATGHGALTATATPAAVSYDAVGAGTTGHLTNPSWSHTIGAGANCLIVAIATVTSTPSVVKCGTTAMTNIGTSGAFSTGKLTLWYLLNPPTGAQTISVTCASSYTAAGSVSYNNVTGVSGGAYTTNGTTATETASGSTTSGYMQVAAFASSASGGGNFTFTAGTSRFNDNYVGSTNYAFCMGDIACSATNNAITVSTNTSDCATATLILQ